LFPKQEGKQKGWMKIPQNQERLLDRGKIEKLLRELPTLESERPEV